MGPRSASAFALGLLLLAASAGCGKDDESSPTPTPSRTHSSGGRSWTLMVYLLADNDLEPFGLADLEEMMQVGSTEGFNILVQADRAVGQSELPVGGLENWTSTKRLRVEAGRLVELDDLGEQNLGDPSVLADFIAWAAKTAPADRYGIVLWDHGSAWPAYGIDYSANNDQLTLAELAQAFESGMAAGGIGQFGLIGFDACLMGTYETAATLSPYGEYLIASEEVEPGDGWDYTALSAAAADPTASPVDLGKAIVQGYRDASDASGQAGAITLSLVDLYAFELLQGAVDGLAGSLAGTGVGGTARAIGVTREAAQKFGENPDPSAAANMIDLGDFARGLGARASVSVAGISENLAKTVVLSVHGDARPNATGLAIYFPPEQPRYDARYDQVPRIEGWRTFLHSYLKLGAGLGTAPRFTNADHLGDLSTGDGGWLTLTGQLASGTWDNVIDVTLRYGVQYGGGLTFLGDQPGQLGSTGAASGAWNTTVLTATQGGHSDLAYLNLAETESGLIAATIPFLYTAGARQQVVFFIVAFDREGNELSRQFYVNSGGTWGELVPDAGATVQTLLLQLPGDGGDSSWVTVNGVEFDPAAPIDLEMQTLSSGTSIVMLLTATDFGGNSDYVVAGGTLP